MLQTIFWLLVVACAMVAAHELGHVLATRLMGGRFLGVERHGLMVGVRLSVDRLSALQVAVTLAAGPLAELVVTLTAIVIAPRDTDLWLLIVLLQWIGNVVPWGLIPNDGTRLWQLWRSGVVGAPR